jgi:hypothetical protein
MRDFSKPADVHAEMASIFTDVYTRYGAKHSESLYQKACLRRGYMQSLPMMAERELISDYGDGSFLIGRADLEVAGSCLYELKIGPVNVVKDTDQINRYLMAYDKNGEHIKIACLVYFTQTGVVLHEVRNQTDM